MVIKIPFVLVLLFLPITCVAYGQDEEERSGPKWLELDPTIDFWVQVQIWSLYTLDTETAAGVSPEDRWDLFIRRGRTGLKGQVIDSLNYYIAFAYDRLGNNLLSANTGSPQDDANEEFRVWDAFFIYRADPTWANLVFGYFRPQVARENITSGFEVDSLVKALTNESPRQHIVGRGTGRETGVNLGGLFHETDWSINYNVGLFDTNHESIVGDDLTGNKQWAPLYTARLALSLGDPEMESFNISYKNNYWGRRNGTTFALNYTHQGETDLFDRNNLLGADVLANYGNLNFTGEYYWMSRDTGPDSYTDRVYNLRLGYNVLLPNGKILEPVVMYTRLNSEEDSQVFEGSVDALDMGVNYYLSGNALKLNLHYLTVEGQLNGGDFFGLGCQLMF